MTASLCVAALASTACVRWDPVIRSNQSPAYPATDSARQEAERAADAQAAKELAAFQPTINQQGR